MANEIALAWVDYIRMNAEVTKSKERVVTEFSLSIVINGKPLATAVMTPSMQKEFVVGHLFGQGIIKSIDDVSSIIIKGNKAEVNIAVRRRRTVTKFPQVRSKFKTGREDIFKGVKAILKSKIFEETEAVHSAGLFKSGAEPVCVAEDIGRHNALDKVIGFALLNGEDFGSTFVTSTGRIPYEMVVRCCNANIPIIASKGVPTSMGIETAAKAGFTIVGFVRGNEMIVYSNAERIV